MKKKVLVTGASGFIGRYTVTKLEERGYDVSSLVRAECIHFDRDTATIEADISNENVIKYVAEQLKKCDVIIHLAANLDLNGEDRTISVNCIGTYHMIRLAEKLSAKKFIYISSIPVIGTPKILPITEEHPVEPRTLYHISKYMGEQMLRTLCPADMETVVLRISSPIGVGMRENNYLSFLFQKCWKNEPIELFGWGMRKQNYIDVRDVALAIITAVEKHSKGVFLIAGKRAITNRDLAFLCKEITGSESEISWGKREDPEEFNQWVILIRKAEEQLHYFPEYSIRDTLYWIHREREDK